jgi:hypothetical protein
MGHDLNASTLTRGLIFTAAAITLSACAPFRATQNASSKGSLSPLSYEGVSDFQCQAERGPTAMQMRRLSKNQLSNSLKSLIRGLSASEKTAAVAAASVADFPDDTGTLFTRNDNTIGSSHMNSYFDIAEGLANYVTGDATRLGKFLQAYIDLAPGACATLNAASPSANCIQTFIQNFGLRVFRRPLAGTEVSALVAEYHRQSTVSLSFATTMFRMLMSPQFLFIIENQGASIGNNTLQLTGFEVATRLSYQFWDDMPDETLLTAAQNGQILDRSKYSAIVDAVLADPKTKKAFGQFFTGWLGLNDIPSFDGASAPEFQYLANGVTYDDNLRSQMILEMKNMTNYLTWDRPGGSYKDLFVDDHSYTADPSLMAIYGVSTPATYPMTAANAVRMPAGQRAGVLTRAALLVSGTAFENPIRRGIHILDAFLCTAPNPPDVATLPAGSLEPPLPNVNMTTRERFAAKTSNPQCMGCHSTINPFGFALTNYNALGKYRADEAIFDDSGHFVHNLAVDNHADFFTTMGPNSLASSPQQYSALVADSMYSQKCFSRKYYEFTFGKPSEDRGDGCALAALRKSIDPSGKQDLKQFFKTVTMQASFLTRKLED